MKACILALDVESLERIVPAHVDSQCPIQSESLELHLERYEFAKRHLRPGRVLDIACGVGYGSAMLAEGNTESGSVTGVDCSADAIEYAKSEYARKNIHFVVHEANSFASAERFDTIVSLETVEHMARPQEFLVHLLTLLKPEGVIIASVPITPSTDGNPHHLHDFTRRSFIEMANGLGLYESESFEQVQPFRVSGLKRNSRLKNMRRNMFAYYCQHPSSLVKRVRSLVVDGLNNRYLTLVLSPNPRV